MRQRTVHVLSCRIFTFWCIEGSPKPLRSLAGFMACCRADSAGQGWSAYWNQRVNTSYKDISRMYGDYYNLLVYHTSIRHCSIIKYYNYHKYILNSILSFKTIMIYIYSNILIYSINYIEFDCQFKIYSYICSVSFRDTIMA